MTGLFDEKLNLFFGSEEGAYTQITDKELEKSTYNVKAVIRVLLEKHIGEENIPRVGVTEEQSIVFRGCDYSILNMEEEDELQCKYSKKNKKEMTMYFSRNMTQRVRPKDYFYVYFIRGEKIPFVGVMSEDRWDRICNRNITNNQTPFRPRAQILLQLGEQLIKNENIAILELIKNSYDADAQKVLVRMMNVDDQENGCIEIVDDGSGMDISVVRNIWMEPGNNHKRHIVEKNRRSKLGRLPIGEKGIGRFGVHKLGKKIELVTRAAGQKEVFLSIDWDRFESAQYLSDVTIEIEERDPIVFIGEKTGTSIRIEKLSKAWTRGMLRSLHRSVNTLNSPFESDKSFKVILKTNREEWLDGIMKFADIKEFALYEGEIVLSGSDITSFEYHFKPYELMQGVSERKYIISEPVRMVKEVKQGRKKVYEEISLDRFNIGEIRIKLYVFDRDSAIVNQFILDKKSFKDYLDENGGISVFRDGIRVLDYGEPGNDWLGLDLRRVNNPSQNISNNLVLGAVYLERESSSSLKEKANREGFIEDEAYECFKDAVLFALNRFTAYRNIDKENIRLSTYKVGKEPVQETISEIRLLVNNAKLDEKTHKQLDNALKKVESELEFLKERYVKTANAGLSYGIVIHEIEKIIGELKIAAKEAGTSKKIKRLSKHLSKLIDSYSELLRNRSKENNDLKKIVAQALFSMEYRLTAHNIKVCNTVENYRDTSIVKCASNMIIGAIINIIDNSIYWTTYSKVPNKEIYIGLSEEIEGCLSIVIADNGVGYRVSGEDAIKPFVSLKNDGLGLGLNIVNEIMLAQSGKLIIPDRGEIEVPEKYNGGAITVLAFRKEK